MIGCGASFYPTMEDSTCVVEVQKGENGEWEAFAADPLPMEITDEIRMVLARTYLPSPILVNSFRSPRNGNYNFNTPLSPPETHHLQGHPIIARYPLEEWELANRPNLSLIGWSKLAIAISLNSHPFSQAKCKFLRCFDITRDPKQRTQQKNRSTPRA